MQGFSDMGQYLAVGKYDWICRASVTRRVLQNSLRLQALRRYSMGRALSKSAELQHFCCCNTEIYVGSMGKLGDSPFWTGMGAPGLI